MTTVIVIDDDRNIVMLLSDLLEMFGIRIVGKGYNGSDAVELYKKLNPDIVFTDVMMPRTDGFYALEKIREYDPNAKVVAVTADLTSETAKRLKVLKVSAIVYKPFDITEIKQVLMTKLDIKINDA
ncbi:MAG: response regulator [Thaumarchaeota archaeon]|nr:response regulator [Nitrososphaerota archaeon]